MLKIVSIPRSLGKFFKKVGTGMSTSLQLLFHLYVTGLLLSPRANRDVSHITALFLSATSRSNMARFFTDYYWDHELALKQARDLVMGLLMYKLGDMVYLLLDDTSNAKTGRHGKALAKLRDHNQSFYYNGHCAVFLALLFGDVTIPLDLKPYISKEKCEEERLEFHTKNELAAEMLRAVELPKRVRVTLLFDCWFLNPTVISAAKERKFHYISYLRSNRNMILKSGKKVKVRDHARVARYQPLNYCPRGHVGHAECHQLVVTLSSLKSKFKVVLVRSAMKKGKITEKYLVTDQLSLPMVTVVERYDLRWEIECFFRDGKQEGGISGYQMHSLMGVVRHLYASTIATLALIYLKLTQEEKSFATLGEVRRHLEEEAIRDTMAEVAREARKGASVSSITNRYFAHYK